MAVLRAELVNKNMIIMDYESRMAKEKEKTDQANEQI